MAIVVIRAAAVVAGAHVVAGRAAAVVNRVIAVDTA
jgi:hypothetical protein